MKRTTLALPAATVAAALVLAACGGNGDDGEAQGPSDEFDPEEAVTLTLQMWGNDDRADRYQRSIDLFNEE